MTNSFLSTMTKRNAKVVINILNCNLYVDAKRLNIAQLLANQKTNIFIEDIAIMQNNNN
jgi:hypothetical protein